MFYKFKIYQIIFPQYLLFLVTAVFFMKEFHPHLNLFLYMNVHYYFRYVQLCKLCSFYEICRNSLALEYIYVRFNLGVVSPPSDILFEYNYVPR